jgi:inosine-uridine nucleoside N-ribohydrolase
MLPLDSTQIHMEMAQQETIFSHGTPLTDQLTLLYHQWATGSEGQSAVPTLYDPVAVTYVIRPDLCPTKSMRVEVDDKGFTRRVEGAPNAEVCLESNESGFLQFMLARITQK